MKLQKWRRLILVNRKNLTIELSRRKKLTSKARLKFIESHGRICHICKGRIETDQAWELDHVIPLALGGDDEPDNWRPAHKKCHGEKTKDDVKVIAKAKRVEIKHNGAKAPAKVKIQSKPFEKKERKTKPSLPPRGLYKRLLTLCLDWLLLGKKRGIS